MTAATETPSPLHELEAEVMDEAWTQGEASVRGVMEILDARKEYADLRAQAGVDSLVKQFGDVALGHFVRQMAQLDPERRRQLQRLARTT